MDNRIQMLYECAEAGGLYLQWYTVDGNVIYRANEDPLYDEEILAELDRIFPEEKRCDIFVKFEESQLFDVFDVPERPFLAGVAVRDQKKNLTSCLCLMGIAEDSDQSDILSLRTTNQRFQTTLKLMSHIIAYQQEIDDTKTEISAQLEYKITENDKDHQELERNSVLTEILTELESEDAFQNVAERVLTLAAKHLDMTEAALLHKKQDKVSAISEYAKTPTKSIAKKLKNRPAQGIPFFTGRPYTISAGTELPQAFALYFREYEIEAGVFYPLFSNDENLMYVQYTDTDNRKWTTEDLQFLNNVTELLQTLLNRRVSQKSTVDRKSSYEIILGNSGCGVQVLAVSSNEVLYTNPKMDAFPIGADSRYRMRQLALMRGIVGERSQEFYAEAEDLWFDLTFTDVTWFDHRDVRVMTVKDITPLKRYQKRLEKQTITDHATGLNNRKSLEEDLRKELQLATDRKAAGYLMDIRVLHYDDIRRTLGRETAEQLLLNATDRLTRIGGLKNTVYKMGDDEFLLLVPTQDKTVLDNIERRLREYSEERPELLEHAVSSMLSVGVVKYPEDGTKLSELLGKLDTAIRVPKDVKMTSVISYYNETLPGSDLKRGELETSLREAVQDGCTEFEVYYQPILDGRESGRVCIGAEALVRWRSKANGFMLPPDFVPLASTVGLMPAIGKRVMDVACRRARYWNELGRPDYKIQINLSLEELMQKDLLAQIQTVLKTSELNPENLVLEIPSDYVSYDPDQAEKMMSQLKKLGVGIVLDHFGKGDVAGATLKKLPVDQLKIDRQVVKGIEGDAFSEVLVENIAKLSGTLDIKVGAVGVEHSEQADALKKAGVAELQGYMYDMPLSKDDFEKKYL